MQRLRQYLRYAERMLANKSRFTLIAVITLSLGVGIEYDTDPRVPPTYFNFVGRFRPTPATNVSLFVGQRRGTLRCEGGVCREVPPFEGVRVDATARF